MGIANSRPLMVWSQTSVCSCNFVRQTLIRFSGTGLEGVQEDGGIRAAALPIFFGSRSRPGSDPSKRRKENQDCFIVQVFVFE